MGVLSRLFPGSRFRTGSSSAEKSAEGEYRAGPYYLPVTGGLLSAEAGQYANWWQLGHNVGSLGGSPMVEACVSAYAQTVAMCPGDHWRTAEDGGRSRVTGSALSRLLARPNGYQSMSDFLLNAVHHLYRKGAAYGLALRNDRNEISEIHLMDPDQSAPRVAEGGEIFYSLGGNPIIERRFGSDLIVPARDVLHIRLHTPRHPLVGESPIVAAALDLAAGDAMMRQQLAFYLNQARPSIVLATEQSFNRDQARETRERWDEQTQGINRGGTPILSSGLKPVPIPTTSADDAQLAEIMKLSEQRIALVYRVPLQILGIGGTPFASTELLMQSWIASGLGFALNHIEEAFGRLFNLKGYPAEYVEFDTEALMRSAFAERMDGLAKAVQGGIYAPDEARLKEGLAPAPNGAGKEPRVQQQVVPLSFGATQQPEPPASPAPPVAPAEEDEPDRGANDNDGLRRTFRASLARHVAA